MVTLYETRKKILDHSLIREELNYSLAGQNLEKGGQQLKLCCLMECGVFAQVLRLEK